MGDLINILDKICSDKRVHIEMCRAEKSEGILLGECIHDVRHFEKHLREKAEKHDIALIAEVKKASPSRGVIRENFNPKELAIAYENGGATCLSVLTDTPYFQGKNEFLMQARRAVTLPVLRKDFILDPYQVAESRAIGADAILLIMAAVSDSLASDIENKAISLNLDVLVEVHNECELERALKLKSKLIGINNRNLKTMKVDLSVTERLSLLIPDSYLVVCESGIKNSEDFKRIIKSGVYTFLVGETLMKEDDVEQATRNLTVAKK